MLPETIIILVINFDILVYLYYHNKPYRTLQHLLTFRSKTWGGGDKRHVILPYQNEGGGRDKYPQSHHDIRPGDNLNKKLQSKQFTNVNNTQRCNTFETFFYIFFFSN